MGPRGSATGPPNLIPFAAGCERMSLEIHPCPITAMHASLPAVLAALALGITSLQAREEMPRGFEPLTELKAEQAKAAADKKLVVLVVKGADDACPNCAAALENGLKAVGSGVVKLFARAETIGKAESSDFPPALKERVQKQFTGGAYVTFVVFDPEMGKIVAEAGRKELQEDKKAIAAFKKQVQEAKKATK